MRDTTITALDIGSSKISVIIANITPENKIEIKGIGSADTEGIENGLVQDIQRTAESINKAIVEAENIAQLPAENIYAGIGGEFLVSRNAIGRISLANYTEPTEIDQSHIEAVINDAKNSMKIQQGGENLEILHALPQYFDIDSQSNIANPIAMCGFSLTGHVHLILTDISAKRNIYKCIEIAGYTPESIIASPLASSRAVLNDDERKLGCIMIDIGGGTSDIAVIKNHRTQYVTVKSSGGENITNDLSIGLRTTPRYAEKIKVEHGNAVPSTIVEDTLVQVESIGGRPPMSASKHDISVIIRERTFEILETCYRDIITNYPNMMLLPGGLILTGGTALLDNIDILAQSIFNMQVRIGRPDLSRLTGAISRLDAPKFAATIGLLYLALDKAQTGTMTSASKSDFSFNKLIKKIFSYIS